MPDSVFSSSSSVNVHFFKPMLPGFTTHLSIPVAFYSKHLEGREEGNEVELRSDASGNITWKIQMDGHNLTKGWENFATVHNLQVGDILIFRHEGNLMFHVTPFGPSCCEIRYSEENESNNANDKMEKGCSSSNSDSTFVVHVTASNLRVDSLCLPRGFTTSSGLSEQCNEIILMDEKGRSSKLELRYYKSNNRFCIKRGWRDFCCTNGHKTGSFLRVMYVRNGTKPILKMFPLKRDEDEDIGKHLKKTKKDDLEIEHESAEEKKNVESSSLSDNSSFVVHITVSSLREDRLFLPRRLSRSNILNERFHEISLMNKQGRTWTLSLKYRKSFGRFYISCGWRSFCEANGRKAGSSLMFQLVRNRTAPVLLMTSEDNFL